MLGLPHMHLLLILDDESKPRDPATINKIVRAELPDPVKHPRLHDAVTRLMLHRPCGHTKDAPCRKDNSDNIQCSKHFPKEKCLETEVDRSGYPCYRRRMKHSVKVWHKGSEIDVSDEYVVPYNPYLLLKYGGHLNVEICTSVSCFKYLYKYIFKGRFICLFIVIQLCFSSFVDLIFDQFC